MAEYLEKIQWRVRPDIIIIERPQIWPSLDVQLSEITTAEVKSAIRKMRNNRVSGIDDLLPEFFKALATTDKGLEIITELCRLCWNSKTIPEAWQLSRAQTLFKKGDPAQCSNYRPISLLCCGYKFLATILLERLKEADAEARIWST